MTTLKDKKHPHYDVIVAWAADPSIGIQFKSKQSSIWSDLGDKEEPKFFHSLDYRIRPNTVTIIYRRAVMNSDTLKNPYYIVNVLPELEKAIEDSDRFVKWISDTITETIEI